MTLRASLVTLPFIAVSCPEMGEANRENVLDSARSAVFKASETLEGTCRKIEGYDFNKGVNHRELLQAMVSTGFQASNLGDAVDVINQMIDVMVTTTGGIEEDLIKCLAPTYKGDFSLPGASLRAKGLNRIGNLLVPNDNYCKFEDWIMPILDKMLEEQSSENKIPVYCPALTDGSLGDMLYFHSFRNPGLVVDIVQDVRNMDDEIVLAGLRKTGIIILGGGRPKHHICNANMMRNGADYAVLINTAQEFDGSDSGARPDEAVSWGKISGSAKAVKVHCDATIAFPLLVAETFARKEK